jgi:hypothetical protein
MRRRFCVFGLILGLAAANVRPQTPLSRNRNPDSVVADAVIALAEEGLLIRILSDGAVLVEGQTFDFDIGRIKMRIGPEEVKKLIDGFGRIEFFSLNDRYYDETDGCLRTETGCRLIANTTKFLTFTLNGKSKSITHLPYGCLENDGSSYPRSLVALEKQIEDTIDLQRRH